MKFGQVADPSQIDFTLPKDHPKTQEILEKSKGNDFNIYIGCAKWNKTDLKNFYPRGTKDELRYYSSQFNSIELNATFYNMPGRQQVINWRDKTPDNFRFFPKITQSISHMRRLNDVEALIEEYCDSISNFENKLGMVFLQMRDDFKYKNFDRLRDFAENFPKEIPLAVELRNTEWFNNKDFSDEVCALIEKNNVTNVLVDTAARRDLLHMRLTTPKAFIRYVGANHPQSDRERLDDWVERLKVWIELGIREVYFFVHQNIEVESPLLSAYFIEKLNRELNLLLQIPKLPAQESQLPF